MQQLLPCNRAGALWVHKASGHLLTWDSQLVRPGCMDCTTASMGWGVGSGESCQGTYLPDRLRLFYPSS